MRVYRDDQKFLQFRINAVLWGIVASDAARGLSREAEYRLVIKVGVTEGAACPI